jgi:predicted transcriptional regulator
MTTNPKESVMTTQTRVKDLMKKSPTIISADCTLKEAAQKMESINCGALLVGTQDRIEGVITDRDIVIRAVAKGKDTGKEKVKEYMSSEVFFIQEDEPQDRAAQMMHEKNINRVLVKDENGKACGILTFGHLIRENDDSQELITVIGCATGQKKAA